MKVGLLGEKLGHSFSPQIHGHFGAYDYKLIEKKPHEVEAFMRSGEFDGLNVTIPYKKTVIPYCDELTEQAKKLNAVNTIVRHKDGRLIGHNTDYSGFYAMAKRVHVDYCGKKVLVLGSGGASNTVCAVMEEMGANAVVISRSGKNNYNNLYLHADCAVIVNATPVGMYPNTGVSPIDLSIFPRLEAVLDLIYNPVRTQLLIDAQNRGLKTENGLWMLVAQAKESAEWFTGSKFDDDTIGYIYRLLRIHSENIVLIGMPGCGKTTNGRQLAEIYGKKFIDIDEEIVQFMGCSIPEIFENQGEDGFRKIETAIIATAVKSTNCVIATGGGCVTRAENLPLLQQNGMIIWMKRPIEDLPKHGRPLSQSNDLHKMYETRKPLYQHFSDYAMECEKSQDLTILRLLDLLNEEVYI